MDSEAVTQGLTAAQAIYTLLGGLGVWEGVKYGVAQVQAYRERMRSNAASTLKAAEAAGAARVQTTHEIRRDAVAEWQDIAEERKHNHQDCEQRLDAAEQKLEEQGKRLDDCERDRRDLYQRANANTAAIEAIHERVEKVENGHA